MKILIAGAGSIGKVHAAQAAALGATVAIYDPDQKRAQDARAAGPYEIMGSLAAAQAWKADGVVIATPHDTHIEVASLFIEAGAHVMVEKPISHNLSGVQEFLARADTLKRKVYVVCNMRFHPAVDLLKRHLPEIGTPYFARAWFGNYLPNMRPNADYKVLYCAHRSRGGGVILDGIHEVDYLHWLLGPVKAVRCEAAKLSDLDIDVEDYAATILRHENGVRSEIHQDYLQQFKRRGCEIAGSAGTLVWQSEGKKPEHCTVKIFRSADRQWQVLYDDPDLDDSRLYRALMERFMTAIKTGNDPQDLLTGYQAARDLAVVLGALQSAQTGETIEFKN